MVARLPRNLTDLRREDMALKRAGDRLRQVMQGEESRSSALQAPCHALAGTPQVLGERRAGQSRVEHHPVLGYIGEGPHGSHALSALCEPVYRAPCHTESARSLLVGVKLGEHRPSLRGVQGVVA